MIRQCAILFGCLALGELIVFLTGIKLPSSIIGMLLLTLFLKLGWIKLQWVQGLSDFLVANLGFFFVPPGVALMLYFDVIEAQFWPIVIATVVSTVLVLVFAGIHLRGVFFVTCLAEKDWMGGVKPDPAYHCRVDSVFEIYRYQL